MHSLFSRCNCQANHFIRDKSHSRVQKKLPEINKNEPNSIEKESSDISPKKKRIFNITFPKIILVDK
jgi:hypothetical protein